MTEILSENWNEIEDGLDSMFDDFNLENLQKVEEPEFSINNNFTPSELRISTITAISNIGVNVSLKNIHKYIEVENYENESPIMSIATGNLDIKKSIKYQQKKKNKKKKQQAKKTFFNQCTIIIKISENKYVNLKIFLNGNIQMTGLKRTEDGEKCIQLLIDELTKTQIEQDIIIRKKFKEITTDILKLDVSKITKFCFELFKGKHNTINNQYINSEYLLAKYSKLPKIMETFRKFQLYLYLSSLELPQEFEKEEIIYNILGECDKINTNWDNNKGKLQIINKIEEIIKEYQFEFTNNGGYNLVEKLYNMYNVVYTEYNILDSYSYDIAYQDIVVEDIEIVLINSDFSVGFKIKRENLYELLVNDYGIYVTYEPDIYPGVNSKFFWNKLTLQTEGKGVCSCSKKCDGKGLGDGNGKCKKITVAIFQSGNIIITGARTKQQLNDAYNFINHILNKHYEHIKRKEITLKKTDELLKEHYIYIPKNKINMNLYQQLV